MDITTITQIAQNTAITVAVIIGGIWAAYRWRRLREERLSIEYVLEVIQTSKPERGTSIVSLVFRMKNAGARALKLAPDGKKPYDKPIEVRGAGEHWEKAAYRNCELTLWQLDASTGTSGALIALRDHSQARRVHLTNERVNLLAESRISPDTFWLEPEEVVQSAVTLSLLPGYYVGQVVTLFNMRPITRRTRKTRYTFDVFTFAFEVPSEEPLRYTSHEPPF